MIARAFGQGDGALEGGLHDLGRIAGQERAERRAHDDDDFARMPQREQVPAFQHEAAEHADDDDDGADDLNHSR